MSDVVNTDVLAIRDVQDGSVIKVDRPMPPEVKCGIYFDTGLETWDDNPIEESCGRRRGHPGRHGYKDPQP